MNNQGFIKQVLLEYGLTEKEIIIYQACLVHEQTTPSLLSKQTRIARTSIYDIVMGLALKGLLKVKQSSGMEKQQTLIYAENPGKLRDLLRKKRENLLKFDLDLAEAVSMLKQEYFSLENRDDSTLVKTFSGYEQFKEFYYTTKRHNKLLPIYTWESWLPIDTHGFETGNEDMDKIIEELTKTHQQRYSLIPLNNRTKRGIVYQYERNPKYFEIVEHRYIDKPAFEMYNAIEISGNYVYLFSNQREEIYGIMIRSQNLADTFQALFQLHWESAKPVTKEVLEEWKVNYVKL